MAKPTFDQFWSNVQANRPGTSLAEAQRVYAERIGGDPVFTQGPSREEFAQNVYRRMPGLGQADIDRVYDQAYDVGLGTESKRGFKRGFAGLGKLWGRGLGALGDAYADSERFIQETDQAPRNVGQNLGESMRDYWADVQRLNQPTVEQQNRAWYNPAKWAPQVAEMAPSLYYQVTAALAGGGLGAIAGGALGGALEGQGMYDQMIAEGATPEDAMAVARMHGLGTGVLNAIPLGRLTQADRIGGWTGRAIQGGLEALTESAEEPLGLKLRNPQATAGELGGEFLTGLKEVGPAAFLTGGLLGGGGTGTRTGAQAQPQTGTEADALAAMAGLATPEQPQAPQQAQPAPTEPIVQPEPPQAAPQPVPEAPEAQPERGARYQGPAQEGPPVEGQRFPDRALEVVTARGSRVPGVPLLVELDSLTTSSDQEYDPTLQPRDRSQRASMRQQELEIAANLDPMRLRPAVDADRGAPIVRRDGQVLSGNGRVNAVRLAAQRFPEKYQAYLADLAAQGYPVEGMKNPVLVVEAQGDNNWQAFTKEANESATSRMSPVETARADASRLTPAELSLYQGGEITAAGNRDFTRAFLRTLSQGDRNAMVDERGQLSAEGVRRIQGALLARAYGGTDAADAALARTLEAMDNNVRSATGALVDAAPQFAALRSEIEGGTIRPEFDISGRLAEAVELLSQVRGQRASLEEVLSQQGLFGNLSPTTEAILRAMHTPDLKRALGRDKLANILRFYANQAAAQGRTDQQGLFGDEGQITPRALLENAAAVFTDTAAPSQESMFAHRGVKGYNPYGDYRLPRDEVQSVVDRVTARWQSGPQIHVLPSVADMPAEILYALGPNTTGAYHVGQDGIPRIFIAADQVSSPFQVERALAHEAVGHYGFIKLMGDRWGWTVDQVNRLAERDAIVRRLAEQVDANYGNPDPNIRAAEIVAALSEKSPKHPLIQRLVAQLREWLRTAGFKVNMSYNDLVYLLGRSAKSLEQPGTQPTLKDPEKSGRYVKLLGEEARQEIQAQLEDGAAYLPFFKDAVTSIQDRIAPGVQRAVQATKGNYGVPPLKGWDRIAQKVYTEENGAPGGLKDVVRATVFVETRQQMQAALDMVLQTFGGVAPNTKLRTSLLEGQPDDFGYGDVKVNIQGPNGRVYEIQINTPALFDLKENGGHLFYEQVRDIYNKAQEEKRDLTPQEKDRIALLGAQSRQHYAPGWSQLDAASRGTGSNSRMTNTGLATPQPPLGSSSRASNPVGSTMNLRDPSGEAYGRQSGPGNVSLDTVNPPSNLSGGSVPQIPTTLAMQRPQPQNDITSTAWKDGEIGLVEYVPSQYQQQRGNRARVIEVIKNPTEEEMARFGDRGESYRFSIDYPSGNYVVWNANDGIHLGVNVALDIQPADWSTNAEQPFLAKDVVRKVREFAERLIQDDPAYADDATTVVLRTKGMGRPKQAGVFEPTRAYRARAKDAGQLEFSFETRPDTTPAQVKVGNAFMDSLVNYGDRLKGAKVLADAMTADFKSQGFTPLVGQQVTGPADLALMAQVYRDPRVETLRVFIVKGDKIVGQSGLTQRLPGSVSGHNTRTGADFRDTIAGLMKQHGGDGYYLLHNHPSGSATPSDADVRYTKLTHRNVPGFKGHVVVDHKEWAVINGLGQTKVHRAPNIREFEGYEPGKNPRLPAPPLGTRTWDADSFKRAALDWIRKEHEPGRAVVAAHNARGEIQSITSFPNELLLYPTTVTTATQRRRLQVVARLRRLRAASGANSHVVVTTDEPSMFKDTFAAGLVNDVIDIKTGENYGGRNDWQSQKMVYQAHAAMQGRTGDPLMDLTRVAETGVAEPVPEYAPPGTLAMRTERVKTYGARGRERTVTAFVNPTQQDLNRLARDVEARAGDAPTRGPRDGWPAPGKWDVDGKLLRYIKTRDGQLYAWDADEQQHGPMYTALHWQGARIPDWETGEAHRPGEQSHSGYIIQNDVGEWELIPYSKIDWSKEDPRQPSPMWDPPQTLAQRQGTLVPPAPASGVGPLQGDAGGDYKNLSLGQLSQQEFDVLQRVFNQVQPELEAARRGTMSWDTTERLALEKVRQEFGITLEGLVNRKAGTAANAETLLAYGSLLGNATQAVVDLARRVQQTGDYDAKAAFVSAVEKLSMLTAPTYGAMSEAGRALNILKKVAPLADSARAIVENLGDGSDKNITELADVLASTENFNQVIGVARAMHEPTLWDQFYEVWINGLLSGGSTHAVNMISNAFYQGMETAAMAAGALVTPGASFRAVGARLAASSDGVALGINNAIKAWQTQLPVLNPMQKIEARQWRAVPGKAGDIVRTPGRALLAEDEFFKGVAYQMELAQAAMERAIELTPDNPMQTYQSIMGNVLGHPDLVRRAQAAADKLTFTTRMGPVAGAINQALIRSKVGKLIVPFMRTPLNIVKSSLEYMPFGAIAPGTRDLLLGKGDKVEVARARGRQIVGTGLGLLVIQAAAQGMMSGAGPDDPGERQLLYQTGWQPYSVKFGDTWYRYNRFEPLGMIMGVAADMAEIAGAADKVELDALAGMVVTSFANNLGDKTFLRGISDFVQAYTDPERYGNRWLQSFAGTVVPTAVAQLAYAQDPFSREANTIIDAIRARIPGEREKLAKRVDISGEPIEGPGNVLGVSSNPLRPSEVQRDPLSETMLKLGVYKRRPSRKLRGVELTDAEYEDFATYMGKVRQAQLLPLVQSPDFQGLMQRDPVAAGILLERQWDQISDAARLKYMYDHPSLIVRAQQAQRDGRAVQSSRYIN